MRQADVESGYRFVEGLQRLPFATSVRSGPVMRCGSLWVLSGSKGDRGSSRTFSGRLW